MDWKKIWVGMTVLVLSFMLAACGGGSQEETGTTETNEGTETESTETENDEGDESSEDNTESAGEGMEGHNHSSSGEVPDELKEAEDPTYETGSTAIIEASHMNGMEGAEATISGAYDTTAYVVSYTPVDGGEPVENHKWVIHEELENPGDEPVEAGEEVTLDADHMQGMDGAVAEIDEAVDTTVYMVDFTTTGGEEVTNHKWVTESELTAE
ncbi:YdhK family protein [Virgibacillus xinjiangensis]|uniref:YdhK family protein n=1 Tax=Virgibacillus xinjiangensis TaxID=393090 RepID=A0ABV7CR04_9BACI